MRKLSESERKSRIAAIRDAMQCGNYTIAAEKLGIPRPKLMTMMTHLGLYEEMQAIVHNAKSKIKDTVISMAVDGMTPGEIATALNLSYNQVHYIIYRNNVKRPTHKNRGKKHFNGRFDLRSRMMSDLYEKYTYGEIAEVFGLEAVYVSILVKKYRKQEGKK